MSGSGVEIIQLLRELGLRGHALRTGWELPNDLSEAEWRLAGERLGKVEHGIPWWIGDWWVFGKHKYGDRKAIVKSTDWKGPTYDSCRACATVVKAFESDRRRSLLL